MELKLGAVLGGENYNERKGYDGTSTEADSFSSASLSSASEVRDTITWWFCFRADTILPSIILFITGEIVK